MPAFPRTPHPTAAELMPVPAEGARATPEQRETSLRTLLALHPEANVAAAREDGRLVPLPPALDDGTRAMAPGTSPLQLVAPGSRADLGSACEEARLVGAVRCPIRLTGDGASTGTLFCFDLRPLHGVTVIVIVPSAADASPTGDDLAPEHTPKLTSVVKNARSVLREIDRSFSQILGWSEEEVLGRRTMELLHPEDQRLAVESWMEMLGRPGPGRRVRLRHRHRDGHWIWFEITHTNLLDDPEHGCVVTAMVDISEEMATHEALRAREQLLDRLAEAIPVGLVQIDAERQVVYTNDRLHQILLAERQPTLADQLSTVLPEDLATLEAALDQLLADGASQDLEVELTADRQRRRCAVSLRALSDDHDRVNGAIACFTDITESALMREELRHHATYDSLTGCFNRAATMRALQEQIDARTEGRGTALIFIDLDNFKQVNDGFGHATGDELLRITAQRIRHCLRPEDVVGRLGGDEFLIVVPGIAEPTEAERLADRLASALRAPVTTPAAVIPSRASIGIAHVEGELQDIDAFVADADRAMYASKRDGRGIPQLAGD